MITYLVFSSIAATALGVAAGAILITLTAEEAVASSRTTILATLASQVLLLTPSFVHLFLNATDTAIHCRLRTACPDQVACILLLAMALSMAVTERVLTHKHGQQGGRKVISIFVALDILLIAESTILIALTLG